MNDFALGARRLSKQRVVSLACVVTLACAIASVATAYTIISHITLQPLPARDINGLVVLASRPKAGRDARVSEEVHSFATFAYAQRSPLFQDTAATGRIRGTTALSNPGREPSEATATFATHNLFQLLGLRLALGRSFAMEDDQRGAPLVAVLSHRTWRRVFGSDPAIIGSVVRVNQSPVTVIGIAQPEFRGLNLAAPTDLYLPLSSVEAITRQRANYFGAADSGSSPVAWLTVLARLRPGDTASWVSGALATDPMTSENSRRYDVIPLATSLLPQAARAGMSRFSTLMTVTMGLMLLVASAMAGSLLLVRTEARSPEFAVRHALGATRRSLIRGVAVEALILAASAAVLAVPISTWLLATAQAFQLPGGVELQSLELAMDARALTVVSGLGLCVAALIASIGATSMFSRHSQSDHLRARLSTTSPTRRRLRTTLMVAQVAVAMALLSTAGLFVRSTVAAMQLNTEFETAHLLTGPLSLGASGHTPESAASVFQLLRQRLSSAPSIAAVSTVATTASMVPPGRLLVDGHPVDLRSAISFVAVDEQYFKTIGLTVLKGRDLSSADVRGAQPVGIASESLARLISGYASPVGAAVTMPFRENGRPPTAVRIVGIVSDVIRNVTALEPLVLYLPASQQAPTTTQTLVVRARSNIDSARVEASAIVRALNATFVPPRLTTIDEQLAVQMSTQRLGAAVLGALGFLATLLTVIGTYILAQSAAVMRMREMGIRAALGATRLELGTLILRDAGWVTVAGLAVGVLITWSSARVIGAFLFKVEPMDPATLVLVAIAMFVVTMAVSLGPAVRAARVDLNGLLKSD